LICPAIAISRAQISDAPEILALQKLAYQSEAELYNDYNLPPLKQTLAELETEMEVVVCLKAVLEGRIAGSVRAREQGGTCQVGRLIVHPASQGRGLGQKLMAAIEAEFPRAGRYELFTGSLSQRNLRFYAQQGYERFANKELSSQMSLIFLQKMAEV
jgi:GNAT superfamily N-acetyltransferase